MTLMSKRDLICWCFSVRNKVLVDASPKSSAYGKELVISTPVDGCFGKYSAAVFLAQPLDALLTVMSVFLISVLSTLFGTMILQVIENQTIRE